MARGGGGGGHSGGGSFGGHSGGSSFGHSGGRSSSFGGGRSSSFGGGRSSSYRGGYYGRPTPPPPPPHGGYYGGPTPPPPRRYYGSRRSSSSVGCFVVFFIIFVMFGIIGGMFNAFSVAAGNGSCAASGSLTKSTEKREKMSTANTTYSNTWYVDELGWIGRGNTLVNGLESFYQKTGVQPFIYLYRYDDTDTWNNEALAKKKAEDLYSQIFGTDEGHLLFVYFACPNDYPDLMDGNFYYICGKQTEIVMDENAKDILEDRYWYYYEDTSLTIEELFGKTFKQAGKAIMSGPIRMRTVVLIIVGVVGAIVIVSIAFKWWKARKAQKNKENEDLEKILSTPLETFGKSDVDELKEKYDNK